MSTPIPWATDSDIAAHDAGVARAAEDQEFEHAVSREVRRLRTQAAARDLLAAEAAPARDYDDEYLDRTALARLPRPSPLIEGVLPRNAYAVLRGRDHAFKSFVAVDWALSAATGTPFAGCAAEQVRVLYIAGEGAHGLAARVAAWEHARGIAVPADQLTLRRSALNLHRPGPDFDELLHRLDDGKYGLVIVDTLRRVSGTADGNSSEMGTVIDNIDRIKRAMDDGTVVVITHTDKNDGDTRGYSGIEDDADVVWAAKRKDTTVTIKLTKMKDGPDGTALSLAATPVLESLALEPAEVAVGPGDSVKTREVLTFLAARDGDGCTAAQIVAGTDIARATCYRLLDELVRSGRVLRVGPRNQSRFRVSAESR